MQDQQHNAIAAQQQRLAYHYPQVSAPPLQNGGQQGYIYSNNLGAPTTPSLHQPQQQPPSITYQRSPSAAPQPFLANSPANQNVHTYVPQQSHQMTSMTDYRQQQQIQQMVSQPPTPITQHIAHLGHPPAQPINHLGMAHLAYRNGDPDEAEQKALHEMLFTYGNNTAPRHKETLKTYRSLFNDFVYEYLFRGGYADAAQAFLKDAPGTSVRKPLVASSPTNANTSDSSRSSNITGSNAPNSTASPGTPPGTGGSENSTNSGPPKPGSPTFARDRRRQNSGIASSIEPSLKSSFIQSVLDCMSMPIGDDTQSREELAAKIAGLPVPQVSMHYPRSYGFLHEMFTVSWTLMLANGASGDRSQALCRSLKDFVRQSEMTLQTPSSVSSIPGQSEELWRRQQIELARNAQSIQEQQQRQYWQAQQQQAQSHESPHFINAAAPRIVGTGVQASAASPNNPPGQSPLTLEQQHQIAQYRALQAQRAQELQQRPMEGPPQQQLANGHVVPARPSSAMYVQNNRNNIPPNYSNGINYAQQFQANPAIYQGSVPLNDPRFAVPSPVKRQREIAQYQQEQHQRLLLQQQHQAHQLQQQQLQQQLPQQQMQIEPRGGPVPNGMMQRQRSMTTIPIASGIQPQQQASMTSFQHTPVIPAQMVPTPVVPSDSGASPQNKTPQLQSAPSGSEAMPPPKRGRGRARGTSSGVGTRSTRLETARATAKLPTNGSPVSDDIVIPPASSQADSTSPNFDSSSVASPSKSVSSPGKRKRDEEEDYTNGQSVNANADQNSGLSPTTTISGPIQPSPILAKAADPSSFAAFMPPNGPAQPDINMDLDSLLASSGFTMPSYPPVPGSSTETGLGTSMNGTDLADPWDSYIDWPQGNA